MKPRLAGLAILAAFAGVAAAAATGLGEGSSRGPDATPQRVTAHRVTAPSGGAKIAAARRHRTSLIYKETAPTTLETGTHEVSIGRCPRLSASINGYYLPDTFGVNLQATGPNPRARRWILGLDNTSTEARQTVFGIICLKP
jgi:hypothetical protein